MFHEPIRSIDQSSGTTSRRARIRFLTTDEGGRQTAPLNGVRPQLEVEAYSTSCTVTSFDGATEFPLGREVDVWLTPMHPESVEDEFRALRDARLFEGTKLVASGRFTD